MVKKDMAIEKERERERERERKRERERFMMLGKEAEDFYPIGISRTGLRLSRPMQNQGFQSVRTVDMFPFPSALTCKAGLPLEARIPRFWDSAVLVISRTGADTVCSFSPQCGPKGPVSVPGFCISIFCYTDKSERPSCGSRPRTRLTG